ncbi:hypothetical protein MYAM1_003962 [Malassezia yamatoensis]|uniref:chitin deacetylase n=1 Tax=Malassezia yamatoensis TaxID=253288 RepID=A0AAJ5Z2I9_9BASI|nr:hypothetical protein MYAM1_003962 [Malassezia yamatoensis]
MFFGKFGILVPLAGASICAAKTSHDTRKLQVVRRAGPSNAADMATLNGKQQCDSYNDATVQSMIHQDEFPKVDHIASILDNDGDAKALYDKIKEGIPSIDVRASSNSHNDFGKNDYPDSDPDCWWSMSGCHKPKHPDLLSDISRCNQQSTWGLTFDDGPYCAHNKLYNFLKDEGIRATLFYIGSNIVNNPYQAQRALVDGHDVCIHTWSHRLMTTLTNEQVFAELYYSAKAVKKIIGVTTSCWRPPQGDVDDRVRYIASALGLRTILWQEDTDDWNMVPDGDLSVSKVDSNYRKIIKKASKESPVVLNHELSSRTMDEFIKMYPEIKKAYNHVAPVSACMDVQHPYREDITYPTFSEYTSGNWTNQGLPQGNQIRANASAVYSPESLTSQKTAGRGFFRA